METLTEPPASTTEARQCMNCGRPQDHRWHDQPATGFGSMSNGCSYAITQPETLWSAVLRPAIIAAAEGVGVDRMQAYGEIMREWR